jgi:methylated-DNA-protein-cysteine methyltransferase-like protein
MPTAMAAARADSAYPRIYRVVRRIPRGRVASYGQIAILAGLPGHARQVGYALHTLSEAGVPWHRVVNAKGEISLGDDSGVRQRAILQREGVRFDARGRIDLGRFGWELARRG